MADPLRPPPERGSGTPEPCPKCGFIGGHTMVCSNAGLMEKRRRPARRRAGGTPETVTLPLAVTERLYRAVIALPRPLGEELAEATQAFYDAVGRESAPLPEAPLPPAGTPCERCGGTGRVPTVAVATGWEPDDRPCPSCMSVSPPPERIWLNWRPVDVQRVNCTAWYFPPPPDSRGDSQHVEYVRADLSGAALAEERSRVAALEDALRDARGGFDRLRHRAKVRGGPDTSAVHMAKMEIQAIEAALSSVPQEAGTPAEPSP